MSRHYKSDEIIAALEMSKGLVSVAARALGCSPRTIYARAKQVQAVQDAIDIPRLELVDMAESGLRVHLQNKQPWAIALVLKTLGKDRGYVERQEWREVQGQEIDAEIERELERLASAGQKTDARTAPRAEGADGVP